MEDRSPVLFHSSLDAHGSGQSLSRLVLIVAAIPLGWYLTRAKPVAPDWSRAHNLQLTTQAGTEYFPTFTPDGKSFVYASRQSGNYDLYLQRIGGKNATLDNPEHAF